MKAIDPIVETLRSHLISPFQRDLLDASMLSASAASNPLRLNNFSASFRELFRHVMETLAPDVQVKTCRWYTPNKESKTEITRAHRVSYVIHGGLDPEYVTEGLEIDLVTEKRQLLNVIDRLSKFTHVNEKTFNTPGADVELFVYEACHALNEFLQLAKDARQELADRVEERIQDEVIAEALSETILSIDELATHHSVDEVLVDKVEVISIDAAEIIFSVQGTVSVELQWGSNSDVRRGDGALLNTSFPLACSFSSQVSEPEELEIVEGTFSVDTSSWSD